jgi:D-alanine-D-alanine ligase-like ATP-grasp enzyme
LRATSILPRLWRVMDRLRRRTDPSARRWEAQFDALRDRFYDDLWSGAARSRGAEIEPMGWGYHRLRRGDRWTMVRGPEVMLDDHLRLKVAGNKLLTNRLLAEWGLRVVRHRPYDLTRIAQASGFLGELGGPAVVKPARGSGAGRGVTTGVASRVRLGAASRAAARVAWDIMIEEQVPGASFRLLVLGGRVVDAIRRDPPSVVGDGRTALRGLLDLETARRLEAPDVRALHPLTLDLEARFHLEDQGLAPGTVVGEGRAVRVKSVVNQNASPENHSVREDLHPSLVALAEGLVSWLGLELAGIDIITTDPSVPLEVSGGVVGEVNTTPGLHHHYLIAERDRVVPVAELLIDHLLCARPARVAGAGAVPAGVRL